MRALSETDLELVDALQVNPRASWNAVAAPLGVSALTASRRWKALTADGLAWSEATPGPQLFRGVFLELACRPGTADAVVHALNEMPDVVTVGRLAGEFDLYAIAVAPTLAALRSLLWRRVDRLDVARKRAHVYTHVYGGQHWRLTVLNREQAAQLRDTPAKPLPEAVVDAEDRRLFRALTRDARRSYVELAEDLGSTPQAVRRQLTRMRRRGSLAFRTDVARPAAGWPVAALLRLSVPDEHVHSVGRAVGALPETRFCAPVIAAANLVLIVNLRAAELLQHFVAELTTRHPLMSVAERSTVLQLAKVHGRVLDESGHCVRIVPVDPWFAEDSDAPTHG